MKSMTRLVARCNRLFAMLPDSPTQLVARLALATVFWRSAQTKIAGWEIFGQSFGFWNVTDSTLFLFQYEYDLPLLSPAMAAQLAVLGEFFLSIAIVLGLLTRFSALGLLLMTAVIQFLVYPDAWPVHILWGGLLLYLMKHGAGIISLDYIIQRYYLSDR